ncbi:MAG: PTS sugar transporter subunit IIA [Melioribacteraceae bacterium]|nr:PTS sugar transporter subunit IIA [Melioribacteraceae bacterium]MCF8413891.1 PTS sugar transporter subunit IIA [Melioribacteraceae bacterium]
MKISDILKENRVKIGLKKNAKEEIIKEIIDLFADDDRINNLDEVKKVVLERETVMSTGVGKGFAIPHGKTNAANEIIIGFGSTAEPVEFESLDGNPVNLIFLVVGKENMVGEHIKILSRISRMMNKDDFRARLSKAKTPKDVLNIISYEEKEYLG